MRLHIPHPGRELEAKARVQAWLLTALGPAAQANYGRAMTTFFEELEATGHQFHELTEEQQDWLLAEVVELAYADGDQSRQPYVNLVAGLVKVNPRVHYKVVYRALDVWAKAAPTKQATAVPRALVTAMAVLSVLSGRPEVGVGIVVCYSGLLRARELLSLRGRDVVDLGTQFVLILGKTKRGVEQKVTLGHSATCYWFRMWHAIRRWGPDDLVFPLGYSSFLRSIRRAVNTFRIPLLDVTTHSLRRSGASELVRMGTSFSDVILFGRWGSERAAREYARLGEAALIRFPGLAPKETWDEIVRWEARSAHVWAVWIVLQRERIRPVVGEITAEMRQAWAGLFSALC